MATKMRVTGISFDPEVWDKIESSRGQTLRSKFVNSCLRKFFELDEVDA